MFKIWPVRVPLAIDLVVRLCYDRIRDTGERIGINDSQKAQRSRGHPPISPGHIKFINILSHMYGMNAAQRFFNLLMLKGLREVVQVGLWEKGANISGWVCRLWI